MKTRANLRAKLLQRCVALLLVLVLANPALLEGHYKPTTGTNAFSREDEIKVGQDTSRQVSKQLPVLKDSDPVARYVQRLGQNHASHAPGEKWPYSFHVVNQKEINA